MTGSTVAQIETPAMVLRRSGVSLRQRYQVPETSHQETCQQGQRRNSKYEPGNGDVWIRRQDARHEHGHCEPDQEQATLVISKIAQCIGNPHCRQQPAHGVHQCAVDVGLHSARCN